MESFILIDCDAVHITNVNRQFIYNAKDIGLSKVQKASEYISSILPNAQVDVFERKILEKQDLTVLDNYEIDILVCAADQPYNKIQKVTADYCWERKIPITFGSVGINFGSWGPLLKNGMTICYDCFVKQEKNEMSEEE